MVVKDIEISKLKEYENNPRFNDAAVDKVMESIKAFGFKVPIIVDKDNVIVAGHTRLKAARKMGRVTVPCIVADDLTPEQVKAFRIADNKTSEYADWDIEKLNAELSELAAVGFEMQNFGFDEIDEEPGEIIEDEPPEIDEEAEPETQPGDIFRLGRHYLICGDSTDENVIKKLIGENVIDLIVTDPPYNVDYEGTAGKIKNDNMSDTQFYNFILKAYKTMMNALKDGGGIYVFHAHLEAPNFITAFRDAGFKLHEALVWVKQSLVLGRNTDYQWRHEPILYGWKPGAAHYFTDSRMETTVIEDKPNINKMSKDELRAYIREIWEKEPASTAIVEKKPTINNLHPTMKPVRLVSYLIQNSSRPGENVFDPFGGSGSTLIACEQTKRNCFTCELDGRYCDAIIKRYEDFTGEKAVKI